MSEVCLAHDQTPIMQVKILKLLDLRDGSSLERHAFQFAIKAAGLAFKCRK